MLGIVAASLVVAGAFAALRPPTYQTDATIYLDTARTATDFDVGITTGELLQHDFIVLATSRQVLLDACASPGVSCTAEELASPETTLGQRVSASVFRGTSMLTVAAKGATPGAAAALANAVASALIAQDTAEVTRLFKAAADDIANQLKAQSAAIDKERQALEHSPAASSTATSHAAQLARLQADYSALLARQQDTAQRQARLSSVATLKQPAVPPTRPESPSFIRYLLAGLIGGICIGVLAALLVERYDDRIVSTEGLASATGTPLAFTVAPAGTNRSRSDQAPYALALASLLSRLPEERTIMVTAASARDHSDGVATGLGSVAAHSGQRVIVVQGDGVSRNGNSHGHRPSTPREEIDGLMTVTLPATNGSGTAAAVAEVCRQYDFRSSDAFVLVSLPSPDTSPTALMLGRTAKRAVVTATAHVTRYRDARRTADLLRHSGIDVVAGILLTRP